MPGKEIDRQVEPHLQQRFGSPGINLSDDLLKACPDLDRNFYDLTVGAVLLFDLVVKAPRQNQAEIAVVSQAVNDLRDLAVELLALQGRPATRTARSLFEHSVNLASFLQDPSSAERYAEQRSAAAILRSTLTIGHDLLSQKERRQEDHRLNRLRRDSKEAFEGARAKFGKRWGFNGWSLRTVKDLADAAGRSDEYGYYRLASMVLHGSAGGAWGIEHQGFATPVHRTGPAIELCPPAYLAGLDSLTSIVGVIAESHTSPVIDDVKSLIDDLRSSWPQYRQTCHRLDAKMWPAKGSHSGSITAVRVWASGSYRWYWCHPGLDLIIEAVPPNCEEMGVSQVRTTRSAGDFTSLVDDLEQRVFGVLPDSTVVYPGHGRDTNLGIERPNVSEWRMRGW